MDYQEQQELIEFLEHIKDENCIVTVRLTYLDARQSVRNVSDE